MKYGCPNLECEFYTKKDFIIKDGSFFRKNDSRKITRYKCKRCNKRFSNASFSLAKNQKKRRVNNELYKLLSSGISMRRAAIILNIHRATVKRKVEYLSMKSELKQIKLLSRLEQSKVKHMQFDIPAFGHLAKMSVNKYKSLNKEDLVYDKRYRDTKASFEYLH